MIDATAVVPRESLWRLFRRFLHFGLLAWGGPVAQIAMIRKELVDDEHWVTSDHFNRVLAVYQVLPGPEAHEMCVYFGMLSRGRIGGLIAGLGFMLPGFLLMLALSWFYVTYGMQNTIFAGLFYGFQPAVAALIVRAVHRIGSHALENRWLIGIAVVALVFQWLGYNFLVILLAAGISYVVIRQNRVWVALVILIAMLMVGLLDVFTFADPLAAAREVPDAISQSASPAVLLFSGLKAGLLTFGGAYTVIPYLQHDAVEVGGWMTNARFLDGLALSGILPAPLIIFSTFVGYIAGGLAGAVAMTVGIFFPAFAVTLIGHNALERLIHNPSLHTFLEGVTAGVVGLIAGTSLGLLATALKDIPAVLIFAAGLITLFRWNNKASVPVVVIASGLIGLLLFQLI